MNALLPRLAVAAALAAATASAALAQAPAGYTAAQEATGAGLYVNNCEMCHGANLDDGSFAPALKGAAFKTMWGGKPVSELFDYITANMPPGAPGSLGPEGDAAVIAHILKGNGVAAGATPLATTSDALKTVTVPQ
jgi:mono/diheme cytochrome c family protein